MNYQEAVNYIQAAGKSGRVLGLSNITYLLQRMGNPQDQIPMIHVAGTNGKGSTIAYLYSVLREAGYRTGRYSSPAVFSRLEIIEVDGEEIRQEEFADIIGQIAQIIGDMKREGLTAPTAFEIETAAAYEYFFQRKCDIAIIETGLGGSEDATNVIAAPLACVFTSIGLDHTEYLGDTIEKIAAQKAGIIMSGTMVIMAAQDNEAMAVVEAAAKNKNSVFIPAQQACQIQFSSIGTTFSYQGRQYEISMMGECQVQNAVTAIETIRAISGQGFCVPEEALCLGLKKAFWQGRFECVQKSPEIYLDGAHNPDAAKSLVRTLEEYFPAKPLVFIVGMLADKDYEKVMELTASYGDYIYTITPPEARGLNGSRLAQVAKKYNPDTEYVETIEMAVEMAAARAKAQGATILVYGSLSFLGEIKEILKRRIR